MTIHRFLGAPLLATLILVGCTAAPSAGPPIRLNTLGYLPDAPKHATVARTEGAFDILRAPDQTRVLSGTLQPLSHRGDAEETLRRADFSALTTPGEYVLRLEDSTTSAPFRVDPQLYRTPFWLVTRAMYLWRCGVAVEGEWQGQRFHHAACHLEDAWTDYINGRHEQKNAVGGWHDAGDYNKYVVNAGVTVGVMLRAWQDFPAIRQVSLDLPESGGALPDFLAEVKFQTDWLLTMQAPDGDVYTKVSTIHFGAFVLPEEETTPRYFCPTGTPATAAFVAMLAQAARAFEPYLPEYANRCLAAARRSHAYLAQHPAHRPPDQSMFHTGGYGTEDADDRLWAAAEL
ncbi:MAG TPA: glycoside hydrolase family 9 protein, partial [Candidatus Synoicihabitans sp.]|nr:glycoside hydrolase family 9 protein [Candidatus Synoicihabitans sp.]